MITARGLCVKWPFVASGKPIHIHNAWVTSPVPIECSNHAACAKKRFGVPLFIFIMEQNLLPSSDSNGKSKGNSSTWKESIMWSTFLTKIRFMYISNEEFSKHEERAPLILIDKPGHSRKHPHGAPSTYSQRFTLILQPLQGGIALFNQSFNRSPCLVVVGGGWGFSLHPSILDGWRDIWS